MASSDAPLGLYLHLARANQQRRQLLKRDKLLILAAVAAAEMGLELISGYCRYKVLENNPHHLLGHWPSMEVALADDDFQTYLKQLQRRYPREKAEHMLRSLDIEMGRERDTYQDDVEYAAALLGTTVETIQRLFDRDFALPPAAEADDLAPAATRGGTSSSDADAARPPQEHDSHDATGGNLIEQAGADDISRRAAIWLVAAALVLGIALGLVLGRVMFP